MLLEMVAPLGFQGVSVRLLKTAKEAAWRPRGTTDLERNEDRVLRPCASTPAAVLLAERWEVPAAVFRANRCVMTIVERLGLAVGWQWGWILRQANEGCVPGQVSSTYMVGGTRPGKATDRSVCTEHLDGSAVGWRRCLHAPTHSAS